MRKFQDDFILVIKSNPLSTRERVCLDYGIEKGYEKGYEKAITEFAERLHEICGMQIGGYQYDDVLHENRIDEIATELKGE